MPAPLKAAILLALLASAVWGSPPRADLISFQRLAIPDEAPAHLVSALAQDRQGFLWIGTQAGLVRYDGPAVENREVRVRTAEGVGPALGWG
jgi:ligand-binding sensor domain-containing protein